MLEGLEQVDWGYDTKIPDWIHGLASDNEHIRQSSVTNLSGHVTHWPGFDKSYGTPDQFKSALYNNTPYLVVPFLIELLKDEATQGKEDILEILHNLACYIGAAEIYTKPNLQEDEIYRRRARQIFDAVYAGIDTYKALFNDNAPKIKQAALDILYILGTNRPTNHPLLKVDLPFFDNRHHPIAPELMEWCSENLSSIHDEDHDVDHACRKLVSLLGNAGWLRYCVPGDYGGALPQLDSRALCLIRERLAYHDGLADFVFAMQGLGSGAITLYGSEELKRRYLFKVAAGEWIAAFALSEPDSGSDAAALTTSATHDGDSYVLNGCKTWISNGGIADFYTVFARTEPIQGAKGISAFLVHADTPGLHIAERIEVIAPHPLATLRFEDCRVPASHMLGAPGEGFKVAMQTLDIFRASVAAAALGFARRALDEALSHAQQRKMFGQTLADFQMTQAKLADMATAIEAASLLTYKAAWLRDVKGVPTTKEAAMAKMVATESAQQVIDAAVQMLGARGIQRGNIVERLYREIRALRIYEGATEVQKLIIAKSLLKESKESGKSEGA
jgi:acyl-CoA dehydrogenase